MRGVIMNGKDQFVVYLKLGLHQNFGNISWCKILMQSTEVGEQL
jgi:hypothetical protein